MLPLNSSGSPAALQNPIITALGNAFKTQNGEPITGERISQLLAQNMGQLDELARQGKLNQQQIQQLKYYAEKYNKPASRDTIAVTTNSSESPAMPALQNPTNIVTALGNAFKTQNGEPITGERIARLLAQNMGQLDELARQGKLNQQQIQQLKYYAEKYNKPASRDTMSQERPGVEPQEEEDK